MNFNYACYMRSGNCTSLLSNFSWFVFTISVSTLETLWYLLNLFDAIFLLRRSFWCCWPSKLLLGPCGRPLLRGLNFFMLLLAKCSNVCFLEREMSFMCSRNAPQQIIIFLEKFWFFSNINLIVAVNLL